MEERPDPVPPESGFWFPLDNAAKIYPAVSDDELTSVFRITAKLKQPVDMSALYRAVHVVELRFPYYMVHLKHGFFWYYLESATGTTRIKVESPVPCRRFRKNGYLFRILAGEDRLSVEFSHILADGGGGYAYFEVLLAEYVRQRSPEASAAIPTTMLERPIDPEEYEDAYLRYFKEDIPPTVRRPKAFHLPFPLRRQPRLDVLHALMDAGVVKQKAGEYGVSITVYLVGVYLSVLQDIFESLPGRSRHRRHRKLAIEVPVDLRKLYPSATMRNFTLFVTPGLDLRLGHYSFEEILHSVHHQMQLETDRKLVNKILALHVGSERKFYVRGIPLFVKNLVLRASYRAMGSSQYSGLITNLGQKRLTDAVATQVEGLYLTPPPPDSSIKVGCGVVGYEGTLTMTFCNITSSKELERRFLRFLTADGIPVRITTKP